MYLLPSRVLADHLQALHVQVLVLRIARKVILQCAEHNDGHQAAEEDDHHEAVEDTKPVNLVLEEVVLEVAVEALLEGLGGLFPVHGISEGELLASLDGHGVLRREVHFDNSVATVRYAQTAVREDVLLHAAVRVIAKHFTHHAPHGQIVQHQLVPILNESTER